MPIGFNLTMAQIRDIMQKNVITIELENSALDAATLLSEKDISFLIIMQEEKPIGLVTERDFLKKVSAENLQPSEISLAEIMSKKFRSVTPSTDIEDAVQKMLNNNIRRLVVLEGEKLVGVVTQTDLASYLRSKLLIKGTMKKIESEN